MDVSWGPTPIAVLSASRRVSALRPLRFAPLALSLLIGCGSSDDAPGDARDTGVDEPIDAGTDASPIDAGTDGSPIDAGEDAGASPLSILFIGNSYTSTNNLPSMLSRIANTAGQPPTISVSQVVEGGATLGRHWINGIAQPRINERTWTHVVLQEQSQTPPSEQFTEYAQLFGDLIVEAGARPTWYVTWARQWEFAQEPVTVQDALTWAYAQVAQRWPGSVLACVGEAFRHTLRQHPTIALYRSDGSHPTVTGTYLAATTFYVALTGQPVPAGSYVPDGLSPDDAAILREEALIGSNCADVQPRAIVSIYEHNQPDAEFDFGRAARPLAREFLLTNRGYVAAGLAAELSGPEFSWTTGAYPGISEPVSGALPCGDSMPPFSYCHMSLSYSGATTGEGRLRIGLTDAYTSEVALSLRGTATTEAVLEQRFVTLVPGPPRAVVGETGIFHVIVTNRGGAPASSIVGNDHTPPFHWGPTPGDAFPGGTGTVAIDGVTYDYCTSALDAGSQCVATMGFSPTVAESFRDVVGVTYATAEGTFEATMRIGAFGQRQ